MLVSRVSVVSRKDKAFEDLRLHLVQIVFDLERNKTRDTFALLLHRINSYDNLVLLSKIDIFSKVSTFESETAVLNPLLPIPARRTRLILKCSSIPGRKAFSRNFSFHLVTKDVQNGHSVTVEDQQAKGFQS